MLRIDSLLYSFFSIIPLPKINLVINNLPSFFWCFSFTQTTFLTIPNSNGMIYSLYRILPLLIGIILEYKCGTYDILDVIMLFLGYASGYITFKYFYRRFVHET